MTKDKSKSSVALVGKWLGGLLIGGFFVWLSARSWPLGKLFGGELSSGLDARGRAALVLVGNDGALSWSLSWSSLAFVLLSLFCIHWLRVLRWRQFLMKFGEAPISVCNRVGAIGFMMVFLLPFRLGEVARPLLIARDTSIPFGTATATIAVERVVDGLMVSLLLFFVLLGTPGEQLAQYPQVQKGGYIALAVFGGAMVVLIATAVARELTISILRKIIGAVSGGLADRIIGVATSFVDGMRVLKSPGAVLQFLAMTVIYWALAGGNWYVLADGFGIDTPVVAGYTMMCCVVVGMMIPNSPGNVGSFWYFMLLPAGLYGIDKDAPAAIGFALLAWFLTMGQQTVFGLWGLWARARANGRQGGVGKHARPRSVACDAKKTNNA